MMAFAQQVATRSTCSRAQVGCVITNLEMTSVLAYGYNGNYRGGPNFCDGTGEGACGCVHAEANALIKSPYDPDRLVLFTTLSPCLACAKLILNAGITHVRYLLEYRDPAGLDLLRRSAHTVTQRMGS